MDEKPDEIDEIADEFVKAAKRLISAGHWFHNGITNVSLTVDQAIYLLAIAVQCDTRNELCKQLENIEDKLDNIAVALENINEAAQRLAGRG
jgi:tetrahydromethanopterin S-methyltransferase subunit G